MKAYLVGEIIAAKVVQGENQARAEIGLLNRQTMTLEVVRVFELRGKNKVPNPMFKRVTGYEIGTTVLCVMSISTDDRGLNCFADAIAPIDESFALALSSAIDESGEDD